MLPFEAFVVVRASELKLIIHKQRNEEERENAQRAVTHILPLFPFTVSLIHKHRECQRMCWCVLPRFLFYLFF